MDGQGIAAKESLAGEPSNEERGLNRAVLVPEEGQRLHTHVSNYFRLICGDKGPVKGCLSAPRVGETRQDTGGWSN